MNMQDIRNSVNKVLLRLNNIDRLMTDKVNDYILIEEQPLPILIGDKTIYIGNLTIENNYKFWDMYGTLMAHIGLKFTNFEMLNNGVELYKIINANKKWYKGMIKIISKTLLKQQAYYLNDNKERKILKWKNCSYRYFKKHITIEKLMQICILIYKYNFDAEKKNWQILLGKLGDPSNKHTETYMYFWLQNLAGLTGQFQVALSPKADSFLSELPNEIEDGLTKKDK